MDKRLPIYAMICRCGGMRGERIVAARDGCQKLVDSLSMDPNVRDCAFISLIDFHTSVRRRTELKPVIDFVMPDVEAEDGAPFLGQAIWGLLKCIKEDIQNRPNNIIFYSPLVFIITDGRISDLDAFRTVREEIKSNRILKSDHIVICVVGQPKSKFIDELHEMTKNTLVLANATDNDIENYFTLASLLTTNSMTSEGSTEEDFKRMAKLYGFSVES